MAQACFEDWERDFDLESRTLGKRSKDGLERSIEFEPLAVGKAEARKGFGFDIEPRTVGSIEKRKERDLDLEPRTVAKERSERRPEKLDHGIVVEPWTCRRALLGSVIGSKARSPMA